jgi:hypothetical protein
VRAPPTLPEISFPQIYILTPFNMTTIPITSCEADEDRIERDEQIVNWFENVFHILNAYQSHARCKSSAKQMKMSLRAMELALGFHLAAGASAPAEVARACGVSKQAFGKCLNHFIEQLKLSPLPFQRKQEARENMASARKLQLSGADIRKCGQLNPKFLK